MLLYYITDRKSFAGNPREQRAALLRRITDAARAAVELVQLREKDLATMDLEELAREAVALVRQNSATTKLLINTRADIALAVGADGVHLPAGSAPVTEIRSNWLRRTKNEPLIGISAHSIEDLRELEARGANFAVLAPIFEKIATKAAGIGMNVLREACAGARTPLLALGGVNRYQCTRLPRCWSCGSSRDSAISRWRSQQHRFCASRACQAKHVRKRLERHSYFADLRRGLCLAETERMISFPLPFGAKGFLHWVIAAAISASTSGRSKVSFDSKRIKRF